MLGSGILFKDRQVDLGPHHGQWIILTCYAEWMTQVCDIDLPDCKPMSRFKHPCASSIVSRLISDTHNWMGYRSLGTMRISSDFYVAGDVCDFSCTVLDSTSYLRIIAINVHRSHCILSDYYWHSEGDLFIRENHRMDAYSKINKGSSFQVDSG